MPASKAGRLGIFLKSLSVASEIRRRNWRTTVTSGVHSKFKWPTGCATSVGYDKKLNRGSVSARTVPRRIQKAVAILLHVYVGVWV